MTARMQVFLPVLLVVGVLGCGCASEGSMSASDKATWSSAQTKNGAGPLDGRVFTLDMGEQGKGTGDHDVIEFAGGRFHSRGCDEFGFGTGEYTSKAIEGGFEFRAVCTNSTDGRNDWHGTVRGDKIDGGLTCTQSATAKPIEYWFKGAAH